MTNPIFLQKLQKIKTILQNFKHKRTTSKTIQAARQFFRVTNILTPSAKGMKEFEKVVKISCETIFLEDSRLVTLCW